MSTFVFSTPPVSYSSTTLTTISGARDHVTAGLNLLKEQFKGKPIIAAFLRGYLNEFQEIEEVLWSLYIARDIFQATGFLLEIFGKIVGEPRNGISDDTIYRKMILARIKSNISSGLPENLLGLCRLIVGFDSPLVFRYDNLGVASFIIYADGLMDQSTANLIMSFLRTSVAGGVRVLFQYQPSTIPLTLTPSAYATATINAGATAIIVNSTTNFPNTGSLQINKGLADSFIINYSSKTSTTFNTTTIIPFTHPINSVVQIPSSLGLSEGVNGTQGGKFVSVIE